MIGLKVTISPDLLALPDRIRAALTEGQREGADALVGACRQSMADVDRVATGETAANIRVLDTSFERSSVFCPSPSRLLEYGRPPGPVPRWSVFEPILRRWATARGLDIDNLYPIAIKIRERGYPGRSPIKLAIENYGFRVREAFVNELKKGLG